MLLLSVDLDCQSSQTYATHLDECIPCTGAKRVDVKSATTGCEMRWGRWEGGQMVRRDVYGHKQALAYPKSCIFLPDLP